METEATGGLVFHPMDQFVVSPLFGDGVVRWYTITNSTLWLALSVLAVFLLMSFGSRARDIVPGRSQSIAELTYGLIHKMITDIAGKDAAKYFPHVMTLFLFILAANMLALIPMSFSPTSQIAVTAVLALVVFIGITVLGFVLNGTHFLGLFWPKSAPLPLRPMLALIELISYFVRPVSHSIRLAGNIMAGHAVLKVFAAFAAIAAVAPLSIVAITAVYALELLVAVVQAYVFTILTCVYLKDALHPGH